MKRPLRAASGLPGGAVTRRELLRAGLAGAVALVLAACGLDTASPRPTRAPTGPSAAPPTPGPSSGSGVVPTSPPSPGADASPGPADLETLIAGLMLVGFRGMRLRDAPWLETAVRDRGLRGVILFDRDQLTGAERNVRSPAQVARLTGELREAAGRNIAIGIDQEGGVVTRLGPAHGFPAVASEASIGRGSRADAKAWAASIARTLAHAGIDLDFAPVVDLDVNPAGAAIGALDRSFSADADVVVRLASIEIRALHAAGVRSAIKHFPGIGSATTNTDFGVADVTDTWHRAELDPFRRLVAAGLPDAVMVGHVVNRRIDPDRPASLSRATVTGLLRGELGWDGIVVTDDLQAAAITTAFGRDEAVVDALEAGNDLLLFANQQVYDEGVVERVVRVVADAVAAGRLDRAALTRSWARLERMFGGTTS